MFAQSWKRPSSVAFPQVWRKFERTMKNGKTIKFRVQDATEDMYDEIMDLMKKYYLTEEPWNVATGCAKDPISMEIFDSYIKNISFPQKVTLVCLLDDDNDNASKDDKTKSRIVGCNLTGVVLPGSDDGLEEFMKSKAMETLIHVYTVMMTKCPNVFEKYNVTEYLGALGLCVHPDYRGYNISVEILLSRIPLCKAIGVKVSNTMFTATPSQKTATKAGFITEAAVKYDDLSEETGVTFPIKYEECKEMSLLIE